MRCKNTRKTKLIGLILASVILLVRISELVVVTYASETTTLSAGNELSDDGNELSDDGNELSDDGNELYADKFLDTEDDSESNIVSDGESINSDENDVESKDLNNNVGILTDYTSSVVIQNYKIMDSKEQETTVFEEGELIIIDVEFEVPLSGGVKFAEGDTFSIKLPDSSHFNIGGSGTAGPYLTYNIVGNEIIFTVNSNGDGLDEIFDGWIKLMGSAKLAGTNIYGGDSGKNLEVTPAPYTPPAEIDNDKEFPDEAKKLFKNGKQLNNNNSIAWSGRVNYWGIDQLFTKDTVNNETVDERRGAMIVDHLEPGTTFQEGSLYVTVPCFVGTINGEMGERQIGGAISGSPQAIDFIDPIIHAAYKNLYAFARIDPAGKTYEEFYETVRTYPESNNQDRAYGVYTHADGTQTVLIAFGDIPGSTHYYDELRKNFVEGDFDIFQALLKDETLTVEQKAKLSEIYSRSGPSGGAIVAYDFSFTVDVDVPNYGTGWYHNDMILVDGYDDEEKEEPADTDTWFDALGAGADGKFLIAQKEVVGSGALDTSRYFEFEIQDKDGNTVAYGRTNSEVTNKGQKVDVTFYKDSAYTQPIENEDKNSADHWNKILTENEWYYIKEVNHGDYEVQILDSSKTPNVPNNQFKYNSKVTQTWKFLIENKEPSKVDLEVIKKWTDAEGNELNPDDSMFKSVTFELLADGAAVDPPKTLELTAANDWKGTFTELPPKTSGGDTIQYTVQEIGVEYADGISESEKIKFTTTIGETTTPNGNEFEQQVIVTNTVSGKITVNKLDEKGEKLSGVKFKLEKAEETNGVWTVITGSSSYSKILTTVDGQVVFDDLQAGKYLLTEIETIEGKQLLKESVKITIPYILNSGSALTESGAITGENGKDHYYHLTYTIKNNQLFDMPQAGSRTGFYYLSGALCLFVGGVGTYLYRKKKHRIIE